MANYNSLSELLNTISGMTAIRDNSPNDDSTDTITGVSWFKFKNTAAANIYVSGNCWVGLGSVAEHVQVCRRDGKVFCIYTQEGTIGAVRFFKLRWDGYSVWNNNIASTALTFELFLFDKGDMYLNVIKVPADTAYLGTSNLIGDTAYPIAIAAGTPVEYSFYAQDASGSTWKIVNERYRTVTNHKTNGSAIYSVENINSPSVSSTQIEWVQDTPENTAVAVKTSLDGITWSACTNGGEISAIECGASLAAATLWIKVELSTSEVTLTPKISHMSFSIRDVGDTYVIVLSMKPLERFESAAGDILVKYNGTGGLYGSGGSVAVFEESFAPTGLIPKPDQNGIEHVEISSITAAGTIMKIAYINSAPQDSGHVEISDISATGTLTNINNI